MKKLIVCLTLAAFAMVFSAQAGEKSASCASSKSCSGQAKSDCCSSAKKVTAKDAQSIKGGALLVQLAQR